MKRFFAVLIAKLSSWSIRLLKMGHASSLPGRLALLIEPNLLRDFKAQIESNKEKTTQIIITGTNGKTTTTGICAQIVSQKTAVITNHRGANLFYGVVTAFIEATDFKADLKKFSYVIEADEAALKSICEILDPDYIVVTNLFRDQLDRFGELDSTRKMIDAAIQSCTNPKLILNANDSRVASLGADEERYFYAVEDYQIDSPDKSEKSNHQIDLLCKILKKDESSSELEFIEKNTETFTTKLKLPGIYNSYNATAAIAAALNNECKCKEIKIALENYQSNFGRSEQRCIGKNFAHTFLIKNPAGANEVLKHCSQSKSADYLICINDDYADGRDVSWLWDADFELLKNAKTIFCSGMRATDMALRIKYAEINCEIKTIENISAAMQELDSSKEKQLFILPTYTALAEVEKHSKKK